MIDLFKQTVSKYNLIQKGDRITIGLSGGADSVCLALLLNEVKEEFALELQAVHINHLIRGEEAYFDMNFCVEFCKEQKIPIKTFEIDVVSLAKNAKKGVEEFARQKRYEVFEKVSQGGKIATAHNLDDVAETLIFNIVRGTGLKGLCSIPAIRGNIIRPLIETPREKIEDFLKQKNQKFVTDSTNLENEYSRNKIRHLVVPTLKDINPMFLQSVLRLKETSEIYAEYFNDFSEKLYNENVSAEKLLKNEKAQIYEYLKFFINKKTGFTPDKFHLEKCFEALKSGVKISLPKGYSFFVKNNELVVEKQKKEIEEEFCKTVKNEVKTPYNFYKFEKKSLKDLKNNKNVYNLFLNNAIDCDKICHSLILRNRRAGDTIKLKRRPKKEIKAIYNELKIAPENRFKLAVLECEGEIVWAENIGVAEKFLPNKQTKMFLKINREADYH